MLVIKLVGDYSVGVTPVPIPNTEVKPYRVDGTAWETVWESRSLPAFKLHQKPVYYKRAFFVAHINRDSYNKKDINIRKVEYEYRVSVEPGAPRRVARVFRSGDE